MTGGAGFIGSHVAESYIEEGHEVTVLDDLSVGKRENVPGDARFREVDVTDREKINEVIQGEQPELVNHHAAHNDALDSLENPQHDAKVNVVGSINIFEAALEAGTEKIIYASSGGLSYGEPKQIPTSEEHDMNPSYPYGISKHSAEHYLELYGELHGLDFTVLRYGSVYGPRATGGVVKNFLESAAKEERPVIFGDGTQTRDFIHVDDVVQANLKAVDSGQGIYNIGTGTETSVKELWRLVSRITGCGKEPEHRERWPGDIDRCRLDCSRAENQLSWSPSIGLESGIESLLKDRVQGK